DPARPRRLRRRRRREPPRAPRRGLTTPPGFEPLTDAARSNTLTSKNTRRERAIMRITSNAQATIPLAIRRQAGLLPDTEVEFSVSKGLVSLRKAKTPSTRGDRLLRAMRGKASSRLTTDQIMALTRRA